MGTYRPRQPLTYPLRDELLTDREGVSSPGLGNEHPPVLLAGNPVWLLHWSPTPSTHIQWPSQGQCSSGTSPTEGSRIPVRDEIPSRKGEPMWLTVTASSALGNLLSTTTGRHDNWHGQWTLHKQNHHRWSTSRCHMADDLDSYRARPYNAAADQSHTERIHWKWPRSQTIQTCFSRTLTGTRSDSVWWQTGKTWSCIHTRIKQPMWNHSWPSSWGTSGSCEMQADTTIQIMVPRHGHDGWEEVCRMSCLPSHRLHPKQRPPETESSTWQTLAEDRHGPLGTTSKWRTCDGHGWWVFEVPRSGVCTQHQCSCSGTTCRQDIHNTWISRADQNRWGTTIQWHWHTAVPTIHEMGRYKTHTCITGRPRSQRSRQELYESRQESLAHVPHKEELQTVTLQLPSSLQSHSPYIHWRSTIRNHVQSKNTHTSPSLSGVNTWPTAASTTWQIEGHPKVLQRCQVQCQAPQHSHWGQGASAPERINKSSQWLPNTPFASISECLVS